MPIYEYHCETCSADFELLVRSDAEAHCPQCESAELRKKWSAFSTNGETGARVSAPAHSHGGGCGCCGSASPGSCALN